MSVTTSTGDPRFKFVPGRMCSGIRPFSSNARLVSTRLASPDLQSTQILDQGGDRTATSNKRAYPSFTFARSKVEAGGFRRW